MKTKKGSASRRLAALRDPETVAATSRANGRLGGRPPSDPEAYRLWAQAQVQRRVEYDLKRIVSMLMGCGARLGNIPATRERDVRRRQIETALLALR